MTTGAGRGIRVGRVGARAPIGAAAARRRLLVLSVSRWLPTGLTLGLFTLIPLQRGLDLAQVGVILAAQGFVVLGLELPTGGLADSLGRRPVLVVAGVLAVGSMLVFWSARDFGGFVVALVLQGVFRALDSGPLEAWYVDTAQADDPAVAVDQALSQAAAALGVAIAVGAAIAGGLIAWHPVRSASPLLLPLIVATVLYAVHTSLVAILVTEPHRERVGWRVVRSSAAQAPRTIAARLGILRRDRVLLTLVLVEVFWSVGMIGFETLTPVRLAEIAGGEDRAGTIFGPVAAAAWVLFALGSALAGRASRRIGVARTAILARIGNGLFVVIMGLVAGPVGLITAYWLAYVTHGAAGPMHSTLLHRQASGPTRATVLSMNSMISGGCYSLGLLALGPLAEHTSTAVAIMVAGAFSILGALLYRPARRAERAQPPATAGMIETLAPSATSASSPPMKRTSSSPT